MTKEPIMIDDVDVAKCVYRAEEKCILKDDECYFFPNCYYKQLKRKEQECEELRDELEWVHGHKDQLKAENEELKEKINNLVCSENCYKYKQADQLKAELLDQEAETLKAGGIISELKTENEKLKQYKASKQASYETMQIEWNEAKNEVKELKKEVEKYKQLANSFEADFYNALSDKESNYVKNLKQALQEIRQVVEFAMEEVLTIGNRNATAKILEIIQKCEVIKDEV